MNKQAPKLRNYTSSVPVIRTVAQIEQLLARAGASDIRKAYGADSDGVPNAMWFSLSGAGKSATFYLPVDVPAVEQVLAEGFGNRRRRAVTKARANLAREQAARTAWRLTHDLVSVQLAYIRLTRAEVLRVFLPYLWDDQRSRTFYQSLVDEGMLRLDTA